MLITLRTQRHKCACARAHESCASLMRLQQRLHVRLHWCTYEKFLCSPQELRYIRTHREREGGACELPAAAAELYTFVFPSSLDDRATLWQLLALIRQIFTAVLYARNIMRQILRALARHNMRILRPREAEALHWYEKSPYMRI